MIWCFGYKHETGLRYIYTPGIYAEGYNIFAFPFVCLLVRLFVRSFVSLLVQ